MTDRCTVQYSHVVLYYCVTVLHSLAHLGTSRLTCAICFCSNIRPWLYNWGGLVFEFTAGALYSHKYGMSFLIGVVCVCLCVVCVHSRCLPVSCVFISAFAIDSGVHSVLSSFSAREANFSLCSALLGICRARWWSHRLCSHMPRKVSGCTMCQILTVLIWQRLWPSWIRKLLCLLSPPRQVQGYICTCTGKNLLSDTLLTRVTLDTWLLLLLFLTMANGQ